jgi:hypothetical protein
MAMFFGFAATLFAGGHHKNGNGNGGGTHQRDHLRDGSCGTPTVNAGGSGGGGKNAGGGSAQQPDRPRNGSGTSSSGSKSGSAGSSSGGGGIHQRDRLRDGSCTVEVPCYKNCGNPFCRLK